MNETTLADTAEPFALNVAQEMHRIASLFAEHEGDHEDVATYSKEVVRLRSALDAAREALRRIQAATYSKYPDYLVTVARVESRKALSKIEGLSK